jgi:hypothetical protein
MIPFPTVAIMLGANRGRPGPVQRCASIKNTRRSTKPGNKLLL